MWHAVPNGVVGTPFRSIWNGISGDGNPPPLSGGVARNTGSHNPPPPPDRTYPPIWHTATATPTPSPTPTPTPPPT